MVKAANTHKHSTALARHLAMGHFVEKAIKQGKIRSHATAAKMLNLSRNRVSHIVDLTLLAPDIQEELLHVHAGEPLAPLSERLVLELVACHRSWVDQRKWWLVIKSEVPEYGLPLGVCSIEQLVSMHEEHLGAPPSSTRRELLVKAIGTWIMEQVGVAVPAVAVSELDAESEPPTTSPSE